MKILHVSNNYTPYSGGVVSSLNALIGSLQHNGHDLRLITLSFLKEHHDPLWVSRIPSLIRFKYRHNYMAIPHSPMRSIEQVFDEFRPDIVHVHHPFLLGPLAVKSTKKRKIKTVFTYHTIYDQYAHYIPAPGWLVRPLIKSRVNTFCALVDHIIAPSRGIASLIPLSADRITVIPSGLQDHYIQQSFYPKTLEQPYQLLYVGRLVSEKNILFLLDLMAMLPDQYQLTIVGYGGYVRYLMHYAYSTLQLSPDRVRFVLNPTKQEILEHYRHAHLFLFASQSDTQAIVLAESMACSTPVIALAGIGQADIVQTGINGALIANQQQMIEAIITICQNQQMYRYLQHGAHKTAMRYTAERVLEKIMSVYRGDASY